MVAKQKLVSDDFEVPAQLLTGSFRLRMLTVTDLVKDYDAVMTSIDSLQGIFGKFSSWPSEQLTLEQDLIDLGWHQKEFQRRSSFAYTMMAPDESRCLGCFYIYPPCTTDADADVYFWVRQSAQHLEAELFEAVRDWLDHKWPFKNVAYPGRDKETGKRLDQQRSTIAQAHMKHS